MKPSDKDSLDRSIREFHEWRRAAEMTLEDEMKLVNTILDARPVDDPLCIRIRAMVTVMRKAAETEDDFKVWHEGWIKLLVECRRAIQ